MMRKLLHAGVCLTTLGALWLATPEAEAQRRGGGGGRGGRGGSGVGVYVNPGGGVGVQFGRGGYYPGYGYGGYSGYGYNRGYGYGNYGYGGYGLGVLGGRYRPYGNYGYGYGNSWNSDPGYYTEYDSVAPATYEAASDEAPPTNARVRVHLPDPNAEVFFNNGQTQQRGTERVFDTPDLKRGSTYSYDIKARWRDSNGQMIERTQSVNVEQGRESFVDFTQSSQEVIQRNPTREQQ